MGCCQSNLASPNHPANINPKNFIDKVKEQGSQGEGAENINNNNGNKKRTQSQQDFEYSVHGLRQEEEYEESSVSIFDEERRIKSVQNSDDRRKMPHMQIHPEVKETSKQETKEYLQPVMQQTPYKKSFQQSCEQFPISRIDLLHPGNNISLQHNHFLNKQLCSSSLLQGHDDKYLNLKQTDKAIYNQTDRELEELNQQIATMIVMWDHKGNEGKKLRMEMIHNLQQQKQEINAQIDKDLQQIWNSQDDHKNNNTPQQQITHQKALNKLKNQHILQPNFHQPQTNKPNSKHTDKHLQKPLKQTKQSQQKQQLKLHLSKMNPRKPLQPKSPQINKKAVPQYQDSSDENQSDDEYSHCLLSNPTRILNDSFVEEFNIDKEMYYFCEPNCYKKWIENDRKAFEVGNGMVQTFLLGKDNYNHNLLQIQPKQHIDNPETITKTFCILLSIIRDYQHLTGINLIAYRTFSSTSIFMQSQQRENNYSGFRTFLNGTKRIYPFSEYFDCTQIETELWKMVGKLSTKQKNPAEVLYNLTGWIPEYIVVSEINSFEGIFERLNNNFIEGNTIITFTGKQGQTWGLKSIDLQRKSITLYGNSLSPQTFKNIQELQQTHSWQQFTSLISIINVNWNPLIYEYAWKTENIFFQGRQSNHEKDAITQLDPEYISDSSHQYLLRIPPTDQDIELRVFLETHYDNGSIIDSDTQPLVIELYDYMGVRVHTSTAVIRKLDRKKAVYSDVLIFEGSNERTEYVLVVRFQVIHRTQLKYTISAFSFFEVGLSELAQQRVVEQKQITTFLQDSHCGYGINSPYFLDNFYMQLKLPTSERVRIFVQMPIDECRFEINLLANPEGEENLTRLNLETILNDIINSDQFNHGKGYLEIEAKHQEYFLVLTNHTKCKGEFKIVIQILQKQPKALTKERLQQIQLINTNKNQCLPQLITYKERFFYQQPLAKKEFKWSPVNTGPRKRLKSNTHSGYQPYAVFKEFFKNPHTDFRLQKGKKYQFSVVSQSYKDNYDEITSEQDKNDAEPPTLSLGILKMERPDEYDDHEKGAECSTSFKIVLDDAFYVPFGFGFWTKVMEFEEGVYRFVFPRMEKEGGVGTFTIYQIGQ